MALTVIQNTEYARKGRTPKMPVATNADASKRINRYLRDIPLKEAKESTYQNAKEYTSFLPHPKSPRHQ